MFEEYGWLILIEIEEIEIFGETSVCFGIMIGDSSKYHSIYFYSIIVYDNDLLFTLKEGFMEFLIRCWFSHSKNGMLD